MKERSWAWWFETDPARSPAVSGERTIGALARGDSVVVSPAAPFVDILALMRSHHAAVALLAIANGSIHAPQIEGVITEDRLLESLGDAMDLFG